MYNVPKTTPNSGRISGGATLPGPAAVQLVLGRDTKELYYGSGSGSGSDLVQTSSNPFVGNTVFWTSHYWSTGGYAALGVSPLEYDTSRITHYPADWTQLTVGSTPITQFLIQGDRVDLYLMPSATAYDGMRTYYDLIGSPRVAPRYAHGFLACRWGWTDRAYITSILSQFRSGNFPIDAFISDFEWYTPEPDYSLPVTGSPTFVDFSYNAAVWPAPLEQLVEYHTKWNVRFGGIRKPRLGNSDLLTMAKGKGWLLPGVRDMNYSNADARAWYTAQTQHFLTDSVDFYWNDGKYYTKHDLFAFESM